MSEQLKEDCAIPASWANILDRLGGTRVASTLTSSPSPLTISLALTSTIATLVLIKLCQLIVSRRNILADFKRGNIRVAGGAGLFSGHLFSTLLCNNNLKNIYQLHQQLGKSYALFYGPDPWLMTVDLDLIQRIFVSEGLTHVDNTLLRLPFVTEINESLAQVGGDKWRLTRRLMSPSFTPKQMKSDRVFDEIGRVCDLFMEFIEEHGHGQRQLAGQKQVEVDVNHGFKQFSLEVTFRVAFGRAHNQRLLIDQRDQLIEWVDQGSELVVGNLVGWGIMFGAGVRRLLGFCCQFTALGSCIRHIHSSVAENLEKRRLLRSQTSGPLPQTDHRMIDSLMESFESGKLDDGMLQANLFFILLSGFETTANTLIFMFWLLAKHQHKQEKLRRELMRAGEEAKYLDWVISETLRLYPAVPAAVGRILEHDIQHGDTLIKKGVTVVSSIWSVHRWREYWGPDVDQFEPERFERDEELERKWPLRFLAFAAGPRYCIGKHLALSEIKALASRILIKYRVQLPHGDLGHPIEAVSPNMIHFIIRKPVKLTFTRLST